MYESGKSKQQTNNTVHTRVFVTNVTVTGHDTVPTTATTTIMTLSVSHDDYARSLKYASKIYHQDLDGRRYISPCPDLSEQLHEVNGPEMQLLPGCILLVVWARNADLPSIGDQVTLVQKKLLSAKDAPAPARKRYARKPSVPVSSIVYTVYEIGGQLHPTAKTAWVKLYRPNQ